MLGKIKDNLSKRLWNIRNHRVAHEGGDVLRKSIRIAVITHTDAELPECFSDSSVYVPLRVGNCCHPSARTDWLRDDIGDNISQYNLLLNEMTGIYWMARHYEEFGNPEYVGISHYRRYIEWSDGLLRPGRVIATSGVRLQRNRFFIQSPRDKFIRSEFLRFFEKTEYDDYGRYLDTHTIYYSNLLITDKATFFRYVAFIEVCIKKCLEMITANVVDLSGLSNYEKRYYSFFLEEMTSYWLYHEKRRHRIDLYLTHEVFLAIPNLETSLH